MLELFVNWGATVNLEEAIDLLSVVLDFDFGDSEKTPAITIFDGQKDGFFLHVKENLVTDEYRRYLYGVVKSRNLLLRGSEGHLVIYG